MQNTYLTSLIFAFLTTLSVTTTAASPIKSEAPAAIRAHMAPAEQFAKVNLNPTDAETLRRDLFGICVAKA
ncbi:competence protein ComEA [Pseudomonas sp. NFACC42-2]|nr:competence protein ComEA [Pseudomonas sp. NFACC42-2]